MRVDNVAPTEFTADHNLHKPVLIRVPSVPSKDHIDTYHKSDLSATPNEWDELRMGQK